VLACHGIEVVASDLRRKRTRRPVRRHCADGLSRISIGRRDRWRVRIFWQSSGVMHGWGLVIGFCAGLFVGLVVILMLTRRGGLAGEPDKLLRRVHEDVKSISMSFSSPTYRGHWGERTLLSILEKNGFVEGADFAVRQKVEGSDGQVIPDIVLMLPHDRTLVVDSKLSDTEFLKAQNTDDPDQEDKHLKAHAATFKKTIRELSSKHYENAPLGSPDVVVMYVASEAAYRAAVLQDPDILQFAAEHRVAVATPSTVLAMVAIIRPTWGEYHYAENTAVVRKEERELLHRLDIFVKNLSQVRAGLSNASSAYDRAVSSYTSRVEPQVKRLAQYGIVPDTSTELKALDAVPQQSTEPTSDQPSD
jgi:DNA recombination protein RmuC